MKKVICLVLALAMALSLCAVSFADEKAPEAYSGTVMLYSSADEGVILKLKEAFEAKYPNVTMEYYFAGSGKVVTKLSTEIQSNAVGCDVVFLASPDSFITWKNEGNLLAYDSPSLAGIPASLKDADNTWASAYVILMGLGYSTVTCSEEEAPTTFKELTEEKWKDQFVFADPNTAGSTKAAIWALTNHPDYGWDYMAGLKANGAGIESSTGNAENRVVSAAYKVGLGCDYRFLNLVDNGTPVGFKNTTDVIATCPCPIAIPANCPNEELAKLLYDWLLAPDGGQYVMAHQCNLTVANSETDLPEGILNSNEIDAIGIPVDWNEMVVGAGDMLAKFDAMFKE